jgi:hypothetical protein
VFDYDLTIAIAFARRALSRKRRAEKAGHVEEAHVGDVFPSLSKLRALETHISLET